jgi:outer membrane protein TolC
MKQRLLLSFLCLIAFPFLSISQSGVSVIIPDSLSDIEGFFELVPLDYDRYMEYVRASSLMSIVADNAQEMAEAGRDAAEGIYDPFLSGDFLSKDYDKKDYYNIGKAEISQFTPFGVSINAGLEHNTGVFVNPQNSVPLGGLGYLGVELPLLSGLLTDERRTELDLAENRFQGSEFDRSRIFNDLGEEASQAYWMWWRAKENLQLLDTAIQSAFFRLKSVRRSVDVGYKPAVDTFDASSQVLEWQNHFATAYSDFISARNNAFLYASDQRGLLNDIPSGDIADRYAETGSNLVDIELIDTIAMNNPEVRLADFKIAGLEIERQLKRQKLLPKLNAKYNVLAEEFNYGQEADNVENLFAESIKWGLKFEYPLFITEARNELQENEIKIESTQAERDFKEESVRRKIIVYLNQIEVLRNQIEINRQLVRNFTGLVRAEQVRYEQGDGSLFLVNKREMKLYEYKMKLIEYRAKIMVKLANLANTLGYYKITDITTP